MKQIIYIFCLSLLSVGAFAQAESDDFGKISLAVIMPENADNLSSTDLSKIESKIHKLVTRYGLSGSGYNNNFVIYPKFEIYDESIIEGMRNITVVETEFNLFIKQVDNNMMFASYSKSIKGSGFDKSKAIKDAISKIPTTDPKVQAFIQEGKEKILDYYEKNCETIILQAESLTKRDEYEQAIGLLMTIPSEVGNCYTLAQSKTVEVYDAFKERYCEKLLTLAKAESEKSNYDKALDYIAQMDASTECYKEAEKLIAANQEKFCVRLLTLAKAESEKNNYEKALDYIGQMDASTECYKEAEKLVAVNREKYCVRLLTFAKTEFEKNNYDKALDYIANMDASTECYKDAEKLVAANQEKFCKQYLLKAKTSIASQDYYNASRYLRSINPETSCYSEAQGLVKQIEQKITASERLAYERKREKEKEQVQLEKYRISAAKEVAKAYYASRPKTVNYTTVNF